MRRKSILKLRAVGKMTAIVLVAAMLVMDIPNELLVGMAYVHATEPENAVWKEIAVNELQKDGEESKEKQAGYETEQDDDALLLMEEELKILEEEEASSSRFIVKYKDSGKKNIAKLQKASKKAYKLAKHKKSQKKAQRKGRLKNVNAARLEEFEKRMEDLRSEEENVQGVSIQEMLVEDTACEIIALEEAIDPELFIEQINREMGNEIAYIQPDYVMELSADIYETTFESEEENGAEETSDKAEGALETEEVMEDNEDVTDSIVKETDVKAKTKIDLSDRVYNREQDLQGAWEISRGEGVIVAIIDTGADISHPMIMGQIVEGYDFYNNSSNVYNPDLGMDQLHGTHITGIIAQSAPEAKIMSLKVFENGKAYTSDIIRAIEFAEANGATIVNMSFGSTDDNHALREAIAQSGMFFVCAAGNNRTNIDETPIYPASFGLDNTISVAALNQDLGMSYFSNYGMENVDISAWGHDIYSAYPGGEYGMLNGTSMSAGYVSAAAALAASANGTENLKETLKNTSDKLSCLEGKVNGGNKVSFINAVSGTNNTEVIMVTPEDDYDVFGYQPTVEENWELFAGTVSAEVAVAYGHTMVLKDDGTVWTWGLNDYGQLGDGTTINRSTPVKVIGLSNVKAISTSHLHCLALKEDGTVWAWGYNSSGVLGDGTTTNRSTPGQVIGLSNVKSISAGGFHNMAIQEDGSLWTWGDNYYGQLGNNRPSSYGISPVKITSIGKVVSISAGINYSMAIKENGSLMSWGDNTYGQLGDGSWTNRYTPVQVSGLSGVKEISAGSFCGMAITGDGNAWSWGQTLEGDFNTPRQIAGLSGAKKIAAGYLCGMATKADGSLWGWGVNAYGRVGGGTVDKIMSPVQIGGIGNVELVSTRNIHGIALCKDGSVWTWGSNNYGQLGDGLTSDHRKTPYPVLQIRNIDFDRAANVTVDEPLSGSIVEGGEYRYYKFTPPVTTYYAIQSISSFDTYGHLYNSTRAEISYNDDGNCAGESSNCYDFYMKYKLTAGATYYIAFRAYSANVTGAYTLKVGYWSEAKYFYGIPGGYAPTGNYSQTHTDMTVPSVLGDIPFSRTYNSLESANPSIVGKGFHFNYSMRIINNTSEANVVMPDSSWRCFAKNADGTYAAMNCRGNLKRDATTGKYTFETLDQMRYGFTSAGYLEYMEDFKGNRITITTDTAGKITAMADPSGLWVSFAYSGSLLTKITDNESGRTVQYAYSNNCLATATDEGGFLTGYIYENGLLARVTSVNTGNVVASMTYNTSADYAGKYNGLIKTIINDQDLVSTYDYSLRPSRQIKIIDYNSITIQDYSAVLDITQTKIAPADKPGNPSELTKSVFNTYHEVTGSEDILGNKTNYEYDSKGNLTKITYPEVSGDNGSLVRSTEEYKYDPATNDQIEYTDQSGGKTFYGYDAYHNLTTVTRPLNGINYVINRYEYYTDSTYPIKGLLKKETGPLGDASNYIRYEYSFTPNSNPARTVKTIKCVGGTDWKTISEYDRVGRLVKETTPMGITTANEYNSVTGLLKKTEIQDNGRLQQTISHEYDAFGNETKETVTSPNITPIVTEYTSSSKNGNLLSEKDAAGILMEYQYDKDGNEILEKEKDSNGKELAKTIANYDELGCITRETTTAANASTETVKTEYSFDAVRKVNITTTTDEFGGRTVTETDYDGRLLKEENPNGLVQVNTYYTGGQVKREEYRDKSNNVLKWTEYVYDAWGRVTKQTSSFDETGNAESIYTYDIAGNVLVERTKTDADKYTKTSNTYDAWGNRIIIRLEEAYFDARGGEIGDKCERYVQTLYDWDGQVLLECKGLMSTFSNIMLKNFWNSTSVTGYSITKYKYDNFRQLIEKTDAMGKTESHQYDYAGRLVKTNDKNNVVHEKRYDEAGRIKMEVSAGEIIKAYVYGADGNISSVTEGLLKVRTTIDAPVIENASTISYEYDGIGDTIKETCKESFGSVIKTFSETNLLTGKETLETVTVGGSVKQQVKKVYNASGQLTAVYDKGILKASYAYDLLGQLLATTNANGTTETNTYNKAGLVTSTINKRSSIVLSQYNYTYYYDGNQKTKIDSTGTTEYTYDGCGQLLKAVLGNRVTPPDNTSLANAAVITVETPTGVSIAAVGQMRYFKFTPAATGTYVIASTDNGSVDPYGFLYTPSGTQLAYNDDGNGNLNFKISYMLNAGTEYVIGAIAFSSGIGSYTLTVTQQSGNSNTSLANAAIIAAGAPAKVSINAASQMRYFKFTPATTGTYVIASTDNGSSDPRGYLYTSGGTQLAYNDDSDGGRNFKITYTLNAGTQYVIGANMYSTGTGGYTLTVRPSGGNTVQEYLYDFNGNRFRMTERKNGIVTITNLTYDKNDRLIKEKTGSQAEVTYSYDSNGNMTGKSDGTVQVFDALDRMTQYQKGSIIANYTYYPDDMRKNKGITTQVWMGDEIALDLSGTTVISSYIHGYQLITSSYGWYQYNAHGDVMSLADGNGNVTRNYDYDPFGVQIGYNAGVDNNPYRYSGEYYDIESGYTYLRSRYYDPSIGRFISEDQAFDGNNWYVYCENNPVNKVDPSGQWSSEIHYRLTNFIAKGIGFTASDAKIIAAGDRMTDKDLGDWSSYLIGKNIPKAAIKEIKRLAKANQTGFTYRKNGDKRLAAHYAFTSNKDRIRKGKAATESFGKGLSKSVKAFKKGKAKDYVTRLLLLGIRLHAQQDYWAHGVKRGAKGFRSHSKYSDDISYDYDPNHPKHNKLGFVKVDFENNKRLKNMVNNTYNYLNRAYKKLKTAKGTLGTRTIKNKAGARKEAFKFLR